MGLLVLLYSSNGQGISMKFITSQVAPGCLVRRATVQERLHLSLWHARRAQRVRSVCTSDASVRHVSPSHARRRR